MSSVGLHDYLPWLLRLPVCRHTYMLTIGLTALSALTRWVSGGELRGRFLFDLGQSLYEGGLSRAGKMMRELGRRTANPAEEGQVSGYLSGLILRWVGSNKLLAVRSSAQVPTVSERVSESQRKCVTIIVGIVIVIFILSMGDGRETSRMNT